MPTDSALAIFLTDNRGDSHRLSFDGNTVHIGAAPGMFDKRSIAMYADNVCIGLGTDYEAAEPWSLTPASSSLLIGLCKRS